MTRLFFGKTLQTTRIRKGFLVLAIALSAHYTCLAQADGLPKDTTSFEYKNALYVEGLGRCPLYSLNYERTVVRLKSVDTHIGMNIGAAYHQINYDFGMYLPAGLNITYGRNNRKVTLNAGVVIVMPLPEVEGLEMSQYYTIGLGYRYAFKNSNFMQLSGMINMNEQIGKITPSIGVTVGKLFGIWGLRNMEGPEFSR